LAIRVAKIFVANALKLNLVALLLIGFTSCDSSGRKRPIGYGKVGPIADLEAKEVIDAQKIALLVRRDAEGIYGMSTLCPVELRPLKAHRADSGPVLFCDVCGSEYDENGHVLKGEAKRGLPFYELVAAEGVPGGPVDTLYARIGIEVSESWRLPFPKQSKK